VVLSRKTILDFGIFTTENRMNFSTKRYVEEGTDNVLM